MNHTTQQAFMIIGFKSSTWLAQKLGINPATLKAKISGNSEFKISESEAIKEIYFETFTNLK
jgi:DNA-binding CsgD family transcriptional regulator